MAFVLQELAPLTALVPSILLVWLLQSVRSRSPGGAAATWGTFALGSLSAGAIFLVAPPLLAWAKGLGDPVLRALGGAFAVAAIPEETLKLWVLGAFVLAFGRVRNTIDGIVYGVAASLGFASLETALFASRGGWEAALPRMFTSIPCHAFLGVVMGRLLAHGALHKAHRSKSLLLAWVIPILLHGAYDWSLLTIATRGDRAGGAGPGWLVLASLTLGIVLIGGIAWATLTIARARGAPMGLRPASVSTPTNPGDEVRALIYLALGGIAATVGSWAVGALALNSLENRPLRAEVLEYKGLIFALGSASLLLGAWLFAHGLRLRRRCTDKPARRVRAPRSVGVAVRSRTVAR